MPPAPGVLLVGNHLAGGVAARTVGGELARRLAEAGWQVFTTSSAHARLLRLGDMVATVWRRRREYAVAQVDVYSGPAFVWAEVVSRELTVLGKPFVLTLHGGNLPIFADRWPGRVQRLLMSAAAVTTPSNYLGEAMAPYGGQLRTLPNGLSLASYRFRAREPLRPRLLWLRAFHRTYNPALGPAVLARLVADVPDVTLTMVGPDDGDGSRAEALRVAETAGVLPRLQLPGVVPRTDVPAWMDRGDIFLNTANVDNTPVSVLEAMAAGLCIVSTAVGGIPYLLEHERDALLVPPNDADAMANAVRRLLADPVLAARLARAANTKVNACDWTAIVPQWDALLRSLVRSAA